MGGTKQPEDLQQIIAGNIRRSRKRLKMSQERLGEACGYHRTYIGLVERSRVNMSVSAVEAIAKALGVDPSELLKPPA